MGLTDQDRSTNHKARRSQAARFRFQMDATIPADIQLHSLPVEAEQLAPLLRGFGYLVVEE